MVETYGLFYDCFISHFKPFFLFCFFTDFKSSDCPLAVRCGAQNKYDQTQVILVTTGLCVCSTCRSRMSSLEEESCAGLHSRVKLMEHFVPWHCLTCKGIKKSPLTLWHLSRKLTICVRVRMCVLLMDAYACTYNLLLCPRPLSKSIMCHFTKSGFPLIAPKCTKCAACIP